MNKMEQEFFIETKKFRNKKTGEIKTQLNIFELKDYEEVKEPSEAITDTNIIEENK